MRQRRSTPRVARAVSAASLLAAFAQPGCRAAEQGPWDSASVVGMISRLDGSPIPGATVTVVPGGRSATAGDDGTYQLDAVPAGDYLLRFEARRHLPVLRRVTVDGALRVVSSAMLKKVSRPVPVDLDRGGSATADGVGVIYPPNAFVDEDGRPARGTAEVELTAIDPTGIEAFAAPGPYVGSRADGSPVALVSYSMAEVTFRKDGRPLQLATGQRARLELPLNAMSPALAVREGDSIPFWWLDGARAIWEGTGDSVAGASQIDPSRVVFSAEVSHFSGYNVDRPYDGINLVRDVPVRGQALDCDGNPLAGAQVRTWSLEYPAVAYGQTGADGRYDVNLACSEDLFVEISTVVGGTVYAVEPATEGIYPEIPRVEAARLPVRYSGGRVELGRTSDGSGLPALSSGTARFWGLGGAGGGGACPAQPPATDACVLNPPAEGKDVPGGSPLLDVGDAVSLVGDADGVELAGSDGSYAGNADLAGAEGRSYAVSTPGSPKLPSSTLRALRLPDEPAIDGPNPLVAFRAAGLTLTWAGASEPERRVELRISDGYEGSRSVKCDLVDDGEYTLPPELLEKVGTNTTFTLERKTTRRAMLPTGPSLELVGVAASRKPVVLK